MRTRTIIRPATSRACAAEPPRAGVWWERRSALAALALIDEHGPDAATQAQRRARDAARHENLWLHARWRATGRLLDELDRPSGQPH